MLCYTIFLIIKLFTNILYLSYFALFFFNLYFRITNLIKKKIDGDSSMLSKNSKQHTLNAESSIISGFDNWLCNVSQEDSRQFEENFSHLQSYKKPTSQKKRTIPKHMSEFQGLTNVNPIKKCLNKPSQNSVIKSDIPKISNIEKTGVISNAFCINSSNGKNNSKKHSKTNSILSINNKINIDSNSKPNNSNNTNNTSNKQNSRNKEDIINTISKEDTVVDEVNELITNNISNININFNSNNNIISDEPLNTMNLRSKKKFGKPMILNLSDINQENINEENYTEEIDEEVNTDLQHKVSQYNISTKLEDNNTKINKIYDETNSQDIKNSLSPTNNIHQSNTFSTLFPSMPFKFNTSPDEEISNSKNFKDYDFCSQFNLPMNLPFTNILNANNINKNNNIAHEKKDSNSNLSLIKENTNESEDYITKVRHYSQYRSSFAGVNSTNFINQHLNNNKLTNSSMNNYTSNCSTNLTNRSNISNPLNALITPKHQKITSDHNISTKPSNTALGNQIGNLNYSYYQSLNSTTSGLEVNNAGEGVGENSLLKSSFYNPKSKYYCILYL